MSIARPHQQRKKKYLFVLSYMAGVAAITLLLWGGFVSLQEYLSGFTARTQLAYQIQLANAGQPSGVPSTTPPQESEFINYQVAADAPRYLFIASIGVKAMVKPMGLSQDNRVEAPVNVHHTGWFTQSARPGQAGAMVIDGHVSDWGAKSVFYDLKKLKPGDPIIVERGDGAKIEYRVVKSKRYDAGAVDMQEVLAPVAHDAPGLNLITCDGKVLRGNQYEKRLVVFAVEVAMTSRS